MSNVNQTHTNSNFLDVISKIQTPAIEIMKKRRLNYEQMAQSAAIATAFIIQQSSNISPEEGFSIAIYHYIEGSKTNPPEINSEPKSEIKKENKGSAGQTKPWWKFW